MPFFNFIRLTIDPETNDIVTKFVCHRCGKLMDEPDHYEIPCSPGGVAEYHRTKVWCDDCNFKAQLMGEKI